MASKTAALFFLLVTGGGCTAALGAEQIVMREIRIHNPKSVSVFYPFRGPVKSVTINLKRQGEFLESAEMKFGNGVTVTIPPAILACFRYPQMQRSFLLATTPEPDFIDNDWQPVLAIPYRPETGPDSDEDPNATDDFPYVQFIVRDWKLARIVVQFKKDERAIPLPMEKCPSFK
jgi:hypothetical protein